MSWDWGSFLVGATAAYVVLTPLSAFALALLFVGRVAR